jgi:hypothetical protein
MASSDFPPMLHQTGSKLKARKNLLFVNKKKQKNFIHRQPHPPARFSLALLLCAFVSLWPLSSLPSRSGPGGVTPRKIPLHPSDG